MEKLKANRHYIVHNVWRFVAYYEATGQVNWLKKFMPGLKVVDDIYRPLKLYCDNNPAVQYAHNNKSSGAAKHIDIKYIVVKDKVRDHVLKSWAYKYRKRCSRIRLQKAYHPMCS